MSAPQPPPTPPTTRVSSGVSARVAAAIFVVALTATAWLGLSGDDSSPPEQAVVLPHVPTPIAQPQVTPPAHAESPPVPHATRPPTEPSDSLSARSLIADLPVIDERDAYAVVGRFGDERYVTVLEPWHADVLAGRTRLPFPRPATEGTISLVHLGSGSVSLDDFVGIWTVPLDPLVPETIRGGEVLRVSQPARPRARNVPRLVRDGFEVTVRAEGRLSFALLVIKVASPWHGQRASRACDGALLLPRYNC